MAIVTTSNGKKVFKQAESMQLLPYVFDSDVKDYVLGPDVYDISAVIGDTITLEQADGESQTKENEFVPTPLVKNTTAGAWNFSAQILDLQNNIIKALFGAMTATETVNGVSYDLSAMMEDYQTRYALIRVRFKGDNIPDVYLPKVVLDSKLMISQLKTHGSQGNLNGTALVQTCGILSLQHNDMFVQMSSIGIEDTYIIRTPIIMVPKNYNPVIMYSHDSDVDSYVFSRIDWAIENGSCSSHDIALNDISTGVYEIIT